MVQNIYSHRSIVLRNALYATHRKVHSIHPKIPIYALLNDAFYQIMRSHFFSKSDLAYFYAINIPIRHIVNKIVRIFFPTHYSNLAS